MFGWRGTAGDLVGIRQGEATHLGTHALFVKGRLEEAGVAVKLHQVEDLQMGKAQGVLGLSCSGKCTLHC